MIYFSNINYRMEFTWKPKVYLHMQLSLIGDGVRLRVDCRVVILIETELEFLNFTLRLLVLIQAAEVSWTHTVWNSPCSLVVKEKHQVEPLVGLLLSLLPQV